MAGRPPKEDSRDKQYRVRYALGHTAKATHEHSHKAAADAEYYPALCGDGGSRIVGSHEYCTEQKSARKNGR